MVGLVLKVATLKNLHNYVSLLFLHQPANTGVTLTISLTHNEEPNPEILWLLEDVKVQEPKWYQGRVEVRPRDEESATFIVRNLAFLLFYLLFNISKEMKKSVKNIKDKNEIQGDPKQTDIFEMATTHLWVNSSKKSN